jgi:glucose/arabinose dehydrogenase
MKNLRMHFYLFGSCMASAFAFAFATATAIAMCIATVAHAQTLPSNFTDAQVTLVSAPTAIAFTPDGRMLIASQGGSLRVFKTGALVATPALTFNASATGANPKICQGGEQGLLGVAVDPAFASNRFVYLYYTARNGSTCGAANYTAANLDDGTPDGVYSAFNRKANRVSRFVLGTAGSADVIDPATEVVLVDRMPARGTNHNAGDVHFGKDGFLYISIGDGGTDYSGGTPGSGGGNDAARDKHVLTGKILRITRDGDVPPSNPFFANGARRCNLTGATTVGQHCEETFAWGLRNPFRFAMDPNTAGNATRFYINDVGQNAFEEVNESQAGADYGWNCREGRHDNNTGGPCSPRPSGMVDPVYEYPRGTIPGTTVSGCSSITGGAFVPNGVWPAAYDGTYLLADYVCGAMLRIPANSTPTGALPNAFAFVTGLGGSSATSLRFGPDGASGGVALYYTSYLSGGQIRKITYGGSGAPTVSALTANPSSGSLPLNVNFTATASDPNGDPLTYFWNFGDATSVTTTTPSTAHVYPNAGVFVATVSVRDSNGNASATAANATVRAGNAPPGALITSPSTGYLFSVGESVTLTATATDPEDGALADAALSWQVLLHHANHTHPVLATTTGNNIVFTTPAPEDLAAAAVSYLEIILTVTDSGGATTVLSQSIMPRKVALTFAATPQPAASTARLTVNVATQLVPGASGNTVTGWAGWALPVTVRDQNRGVNGLRFSSWSDGGGRTHNFIVPSTASAVLTANFTVGSFVASLDIDNDGSVEPATDAILLLRHLFGVRGAALTQTALGSNAERNASTISAYISSLGNAFDIDNNQSVNATTDGLLVLRYVLGLRGSPLTQGALGSNALRTDPTDIASYLQGLLAP